MVQRNQKRRRLKMEASLSPETSVKFYQDDITSYSIKTVVCMSTAISTTILTLINKRNKIHGARSQKTVSCKRNEFTKSVEDIPFGRNRLFFLLL
jgi:hypothetical protein